MIDSFFDAAAKPEPPGGDVAMHDFFQARLVDRDLAPLE
jgi:hypothetical protein